MKKANFIISGVIAAIAIAVIIISATYPKAEAYGTGAPGPGLWPICICVVLLLMATLLTVKTIIGKSDAKDNTDLPLWDTDHIRVYLAMAILVIYVAILKPVGFLLPSFFMISFFIYWFSKEKYPSYVAKKAKSKFGNLLFDVFNIVDGYKQSRPLWLCLLIGLVATLAVYFIFKLGLNVPMNFGLLYI